MEVSTAKEPLKSILNNPVPKSQPTHIVKKMKNRVLQDSTEPYQNNEGSRRESASSESDDLHFNSHYGAHETVCCESNNFCPRRQKNMTVPNCYSYGSAIAQLNAAPMLKHTLNYLKKTTQMKDLCRSYSSPAKAEHNQKEQAPRTIAIKSSTPEDEPVAEIFYPETSRQHVSAQKIIKTAPVVQVTVPKKKKIVKKMIDKTHEMKSSLEQPKGKCDCHSKSQFEANSELINYMETDSLIAGIKKSENDCNQPSPPVSVSPIPKCTPVSRTSPQLVALPAPHSMPQPVPQLVPQPVTKSVSQSIPQSYSDLKTVPKSFPQPTLQSAPPSHFVPKPSQMLSEVASKLVVQVSSQQAVAFSKPSLSKIASNKKQDKYAAKPHKKFRPTAPLLLLPVKKLDGPVNHPYSVETCLRPSLFPRVPPYLRFINHDETPCIKLPNAIQRHLIWKLTSITPIVVKKTIINSGFRLVRSDCDISECPEQETLDWVGVWGKHMKSIMFRAIKDGQKMNHFPGTFQIGRKDRLWRNLQKLVTKHGSQEFGIMPKTYVLPHDLKLLKYNWEKHQNNNDKWIIKPPASARGTGIKVVSRWTQIPKKRAVVVQRYVSKPYLINGSKFDMRLYVLVTSMHPLRMYLYKDGLARFASVKYNEEISSLHDRYMHLTNYSVNRLSKNYTPNEDFAACEGHKWTLQTLFQYLKTEREVDTDALWESMKDLVIKTIISGEASISSLTKQNVCSRYNCYELFGVDVLLDENLKPWLLEVNISPSLHSASPLDIHVKGPLVTTVLNIAQFQIPQKVNPEVFTKDKSDELGGLPYDSRLYTVYLSKEERDKHIIYANVEDREMYLKDILSTLTSDDVRHLIQAEDELTQAGEGMERVFPTSDTYKYLEFLSGPRYYNRLFDAWETRYTHNRDIGIQLLRNLCDIGYHLHVPPVPLKNDVDAPSPAASERPSVVSIESVECPLSKNSLHLSSGSRTCGDTLAQPVVPPPIEPRA